ncbi:MAG: OB-fold domain-containing protein [Candidatus Pacebacteria bacterium]|nr:OB-fold domain-containing protein [Candidatus Paceibacterota bacterium]
MIYYLSGKVLRKKEKYIVIVVNNIGYKVFVSKKTLNQITEKETELFCFLNVKEKGMELYGFLKEEELEFFELLEALRGIGPKVALEIACIGNIEEVKKRIINQDPTVFQGIPGLGTKRKASLILELSGKIRQESNQKTEEEKALICLGFSLEESKQALKKVDYNLKSEEKIKQALKILGQK